MNMTIAMGMHLAEGRRDTKEIVVLWEEVILEYSAVVSGLRERGIVGTCF